MKKSSEGGVMLCGEAGGMNNGRRHERRGRAGGVAWSCCEQRLPQVFLVALFVFFGVLSGSGNAGGKFDGLSGARVEKVVDGDTLEVLHQGKTLRVRLWGIDTPEWGQGFSRKAKNFTRSKVLGRQVVLQPKDWDRYGRLVAVVWLGDLTVNAELVREGLAWVHIFFCHEPICDEWRQLEKEARADRRGLWREQEPVPPWVWKRQHR